MSHMLPRYAFQSTIVLAVCGTLFPAMSGTLVGSESPVGSAATESVARGNGLMRESTEISRAASRSPSPSPSPRPTQDDGQGDANAASSSPAQDEESSDKANAAQEADASQPTASEGAYPEPADVDPQQVAEWEEKYESELNEWRDITRRLLEIRSLYVNCTREEADGYVLEWEKKQARGNELVESLTSTAFELLKAKPTNEKRRRFVTQMTARLFAEDRFPEVSEIGTFLLKYPDPHPMLWEQVGISDFALNDFVKATPLIKKAASIGASDERLMNYNMTLDKIQDFWEQELEFQARDAAGKPLPIVKLTTSQGDILIELFENDAPKTVGNFVHLVESGFYDGLVFHRVLPGFMAQTGCPLGNGTGGPGYSIPSECQGAKFRRHFGGVVSMANSGDPDSGGSQFFLTFAPAPHLDTAHTVFGRIIEGQDVLPKIQRIDPNDPDVSGGAEPDQIIKAEVISKRDHPYVPAKNEKSK